MLVHIDAGDGSLAHADACSAVPGDQPPEELKQVGIVSHEHDILPVGILVNELLEIGVACAKIECGADFYLAFIAEFIANELGGLKGALQRTGNDDVGLNLQGSQEAPHEHALFFAFGDESAFGIELCAFPGNTGVCMTHEIEIHGGGWPKTRAVPTCWATSGPVWGYLFLLG